MRQELTSFDSLRAGKCLQRDAILSPVGPWLRTPKTKRETARGQFLGEIFSPKIPQTHMYIDPNGFEHLPKW